MLSRPFIAVSILIGFTSYSFAQVENESRSRSSHASSTVSATTECRAGCHGNTAGCQESYEAAVIAASPGMLLYKNSLTISKSWPGSDTTGLVREPVWKYAYNPENDPRPISVTITPDTKTCEGRDAHRQSRTHYEWTAVQGKP